MKGLVSLADIAPTLAGAAGVKDYVFPTDGTDMMPYWSGAEPPSVGRTFFWSNASWGSSIKTKIDGAHDFWDDPLPETVIQAVYVKDEEKITCWNPSGSDVFGAVYSRLPDVAGKKDPASLVIERPPVAGQVPVEGPGRKRFEEMLKLISESDRGLSPDWSGAPDLGKHTWWFVE